MNLLLIIGSILVPIAMIELHRKWTKIEVIFHLFAILAALIFGNLSAIKIYEVIVNNAVFMTTIHSIFLNSFFLITGAYLGVYILYLMIFLTLKRMKAIGQE